MINRLWVPLVKCCAHEMKYAVDFWKNEVRLVFSEVTFSPVLISLPLFIGVRSIDPGMLE